MSISRKMFSGKVTSHSELMASKIRNKIKSIYQERVNFINKLIVQSFSKSWKTTKKPIFPKQSWTIIEVMANAWLILKISLKM